MTLSSIDVAPDVVNQTVPKSVRPVAVETIDSKDYQKVIPCDAAGDVISGSTLPTGAATAAKQLADGHNVVVSSGSVIVTNGLVPDNYDYIALSYTGDNLTGVVYKTGGAGGSTVATLVLAYTGAVLDTITKT